VAVAIKQSFVVERIDSQRLVFDSTRSPILMDPADDFESELVLGPVHLMAKIAAGLISYVFL